MPWYMDYFQAAERIGCKPWELVDEWTPRWFWMKAANVISAAENAARKERETVQRALAMSEAP